ncbi:MAG: hypothetical protein CBB70_04960 [Planctomycetaceae bacterium TMED10]|nr:MAG: hypothetical protein CBB70_05720 [Planctomycetaceae bacterium TMED10]OUT68772.1 MAG: hypothetical protein CBB70_04960 [Planctomycetaceae bacterium TMED10]|tara:strand:+ start:513 stop:1472 length:960 start_codon:yes stop_codon:yes gene_type:complete
MMPRPDSKIRAYLELLRLPNVFTAIADVIMGYWFAQAALNGSESPAETHLGILVLLILSSSCFYLAGMVLNDYFDRNKDLQERPARPIPSRRVPESTALWLGTQLLVLGTILAMILSFMSHTLGTLLIALLLATAVVAYDGVFKKNWLGPLGMGTCRSLNVMMGMSVVEGTFTAFTMSHFLIIVGIGIYIVGLTWFARTEAERSNRFYLSASLLMMGLGLACLYSFPQFMPLNKTLVSQNIGIWFGFWLLVALQITWRCGKAVLEPTPTNVQVGVKFCLLTLIVLDAAIIFAVQGQEKSLVLLALLIPTIFLGKFIYST